MITSIARQWLLLQRSSSSIRSGSFVPKAASAALATTCTPSSNVVVNQNQNQNQNQQVRTFAFQQNKHIDSIKNNATIHFDFNAENYERVNYILGKYPTNYKQAAMIPLLDLAQRQAGGWLPLNAMNKVAQICEVPPIRVYEVASFYTMFNRQPVGKYFIQLCGTTPCMICGSEDIKNTISKHLGIKDGQTTDDGMFTLLEVECLGACANAPMIQLNDDYYECLTKETIIELIESCKTDAGPPPPGKWGSLPMNGQVSCEGPQGKTSLQTIVTPTVDPDRFKDGKVNPESIKKHMSY